MHEMFAYKFSCGIVCRAVRVDNGAMRQMEILLIDVGYTVRIDFDDRHIFQVTEKGEQTPSLALQCKVEKVSARSSDNAISVIAPIQFGLNDFVLFFFSSELRQSA